MTEECRPQRATREDQVQGLRPRCHERRGVTGLTTNIAGRTRVTTEGEVNNEFVLRGTGLLLVAGARFSHVI